MPKISIYVPDDMKARMDNADERGNWSGIAQQAFDLELTHLEAVKEIKTMTDVVERLRASKQKSTKSSHGDGRTAGREWAMHSAEYNELRRVAELDVNDLYQGTDWAVRVIVTVAIVGDRSEANQMVRSDGDMADIYGVDEENVTASLTVDYLAGFVEGATEVWGEIKSEI